MRLYSHIQKNGQKLNFYFRFMTSYSREKRKVSRIQKHKMRFFSEHMHRFLPSRGAVTWSENNLVAHNMACVRTDTLPSDF